MKPLPVILVCLLILLGTIDLGAAQGTDAMRQRLLKPHAQGYVGSWLEPVTLAECDADAGAEGRKAVATLSTRMSFFELYDNFCFY